MWGKFPLRLVPLHSLLQTEDPEVKKHVLIAAALVMVVSASSQLLGQRKSSAVQVVTFGVHRSPLRLVGILATESKPTVSPSQPRTADVESPLSTLAEKVTISSATAIDATSSSATRPHIGTADVQLDVRLLLESGKSSPIGSTPLLVTITE